MTKLTGIITSENKLTGSLGVRNEINVDIIGTGARGKEGKSAYEIWLDLGNEGTEQEYLASLKGDDGYTPVKGVDYFDGKDGKDGYTPVRGVDYRDGIDGKDGRNGVDGKNGKDGVDGNTPIKGVDYFDGEKGENGADGKDGYTPQKGVDYFTEADKSEMVSAVVAALPVYEGEVESV